MPSSLHTCSIWCLLVLFFLAEPDTSSSLFSDWLSPSSVLPAALGIVLTSGCATSRHCQQQELPGVRIHCCDSDLCNSASSWHPSTLHYIGAMLSILLLRMWLWYGERNISGLWEKHFVLVTLIPSLSCSVLGLNESLTPYGVAGEHLEIVAFVTLSDQWQNNPVNLLKLNWGHRWIQCAHPLTQMFDIVWYIMGHLWPWKKDLFCQFIKSFQ